MTIVTGPSDSPVTFLFAHGAGAGMDHAFMEAVAIGLAERGIRVVRFNFPYMIKRAEDGKKRPPDRAPKLLAAFGEQIAALGDGPLVIGGKSMGGRMASLMATEMVTQPLPILGIACLGFPFHPPGKATYKGEHLADIRVPTCILQGERDTFGRREEVEGYALSDSVDVIYVPDGDHSFKPRKASGHTEAGNIAFAVEQLTQFIKRCAWPESTS